MERNSRATRWGPNSVTASFTGDGDAVEGIAGIHLLQQPISNCQSHLLTLQRKIKTASKVHVHLLSLKSRL